MWKLREIDFSAKQFESRFSCVALVETCCWNVDMRSQNHRTVMKAEHSGMTLRKLNSTSTSLQFSTARRGRPVWVSCWASPVISI